MEGGANHSAISHFSSLNTQGKYSINFSVPVCFCFFFVLKDVAPFHSKIFIFTSQG